MRDVHDNLDGIEAFPDEQNIEAAIYSNITSGDHELPIDMRFNDGHKLSIIVYSFLFVFSAIANITVLVLLLKRRRNNPSRINMMLIHLAIADLLVTFLMMPLEIAWSITVMWIAGDVMCRVMLFFRMFGLYLSSFLLVCISIDRYYAVLKPLLLSALDRRGRVLIIAAWTGAVLCSIPQSIVFHVERHPIFKSYTQCVTFNSFSSRTMEISYAAFGMLMMYAFPLVVIISSYAAILMEICRRTRNPTGDSITRSSLPFLSKAKIRTLKMTIIIVCVFFICWTPYYIMSIWYWIDHKSAEKVDVRLQKFLFLFACTNSCMNPLVYGAFNLRVLRKVVRREGPNVVSDRSSIKERPEIICLVSWRKARDEGHNITITERTSCSSLNNIHMVNLVSRN
ncbi:adipokinetic hormone/corazonin-related peptide receptor variant I [Harmonia axyridis]|uniref:adipokinetic hormone/corazonin-related peptide receptor variant I n=1 Tax=Harmonia axyridis TaxID=115357 RepID=UPI001E276E54|nr:adipokinetic hormone/corazonin-related peptide receptor variant I [Harmonia axyridis]